MPHCKSVWQHLIEVNMITFLSKDTKEINPDKKMALRFMGCRNGEIGEELEEIYEECLGLYLSAADLKAVFRKTEVVFCEGNKIRFDFGVIESESLKKNLKGCKSAYVFAATAGGEIDRFIKRLSVSSPAESMVFSCIASSGIECWCDYVNEELAKGKRLKPRFSPGYGDVPLTVQTEILTFLDATRKIGLTLTENLMMVPTKSVTAIVGICD